MIIVTGIIFISYNTRCILIQSNMTNMWTCNNDRTHHHEPLKQFHKKVTYWQQQNCTEAVTSFITISNTDISQSAADANLMIWQQNSRFATHKAVYKLKTRSHGYDWPITNSSSASSQWPSGMHNTFFKTKKVACWYFLFSFSLFCLTLLCE